MSVDVAEGVSGPQAGRAQAAGGAGDQAAEQRRGRRRAAIEAEVDGRLERDRSVPRDLRPRPGRRRRPVRAGAGRRCSAAAATSPASVGPTAVISAAPAMPEHGAEQRRRARPAPATRRSTWRTTWRCGQPIAFSVPSSRMRLVTEESVEQAAIRNAATQRRRSSAPCRACRRGSWRRQRAADAVGEVCGGRHRGAVERALDPLLDRGDVVGRRRRARGAVFTRPSRSESSGAGELQVDVGGLAAERRRARPTTVERLPLELDASSPTLMPSRLRVGGVERRLAGVAWPR